MSNTSQGGIGDGQQPVMVLPSMPHGGSSELQTGMIGVNGHVDTRNIVMGYPNPMENGKSFNESSPIAGLRSNDFNAMPQNGIGGGNQYMANMNQPDAL